MELTALDSDMLLNFLGHACNNADSRQTGIDALDFVHLVSKNNQLTITGSNGPQSFTRICQESDIQANEDGEICMDAAKLFQVVRSLPKGKPVKLKVMTGKNKVVVSSGRSRLQIKTLDTTEYPAIDIITKNANTFTITANDLIGLFSNTLYAAGKNDVRLYLNAVLLKVENNSLSAIASDGHRLTANKCAFDGQVADVSLLFPTNAIGVFSRLSEKAETISVSYNANRVEFNWGGVIYRTALVESPYPDVMRVLPTHCDSEVVVDRQELSEVLKRLMVVLTDQRSPRIKLIMNQEQIQFKTVIENEEDGIGEDFASAEICGQEINYEYGLNPKYMNEAINHIYSEKVVIQFIGESKPCCISPVGSNDSRSIIMPVRL